MASRDNKHSEGQKVVSACPNKMGNIATKHKERGKKRNEERDLRLDVSSHVDSAGCPFTDSIREQLHPIESDIRG